MKFLLRNVYVVLMSLQHMGIFSQTTKHDDLSTDGFLWNQSQFEVKKSDDPCYSNGTCAVSATNKIPFCRCDEKCKIFNDCCVDYETQNRPLSFLDTHFNFTCTPFIFYKTIDIKIGIMVIDSCHSKHSNTDVIGKCEHETTDIADNGPFVVHGDDFVFKNKWCALCNNVTEFQPFDVEFSDPFLGVYKFDQFANLTQEERINFLLSKNFNYRMVAPETYKHRFCALDMKISENSDLCQSYSNPVEVFIDLKTMIYRNYFCVPLVYRSLVSCYHGLDDIGEIRNSNIRSLTVMFSFRSNSPEDKRQEGVDDSQCIVWNDKVSLKNVILSFVEMEDKKVCGHLATYENVATDVDFFLISNTTMTPTILVQSVLLIGWAHEVHNLTIIERIKCFIPNTQNPMVGQVKVSMKVVKKVFLNEIERIEAALRNLRLQIYIRSNHSSSIMVTKERVLPQHIKNTTGDFVRKVHIYPIFSLNVVSVQKLLSDNNINTLGFGMNDICSDAIIGMEMLDTTGLTMEYVHCTNHNAINTTSGFDIEACITYSCFSISSLSLIVLFIFNRKNGLNLNTPGSNLENITVTMLIANTLFMIGIGLTDIYVICYLIGVLLHYLWLAVFSFLTIAVMFIFCKISQMKSKAMNKARDRARGRWLLFAGMSIPLAFVASALVTDFWGPSYFSPGYSGSVCFPSKFPANIIFFTGPVILSVFINFVCLFRIVTHVCIVRYEVSQVTHVSSFYRDGVVYMRIVVFCGTFWMFGIFAAIFELRWLNYIFTLICALQGFFIALSNLTTRNVLHKSSNATNLSVCTVKKEQNVSNLESFQTSTKSDSTSCM